MLQTTEHAGYGISHYYLPQHHINVLKSADDQSRKATDSWVRLLIDTVNHAPHPEHAFLLLDLRELVSGINPYARARAADVIQGICPQRSVTLGLVVHNRLMGTLMNIFLERITARMTLRTTFRIFYRFEDAVSWLAQQRSLYGL